MSTIEANKEVFRRLVEEGPNKGNLDVLEQLLDPDVVFHHPMTPEPIRGPAGVRALIEGSRTTFADLRVRIDHLVGEDDRVVAFVTVEGTNTGGWMGRPGTGNEVRFGVVHLLRFAAGRIVEDRQTVDRMMVLEQMEIAADPQPA